MGLGDGIIQSIVVGDLNINAYDTNNTTLIEFIEKNLSRNAIMKLQL